MRGGLDDALDKLARRDELRRRAAGEATGTPPAVTELVEAIAAVVGRNPKLEVTVGVEGAGDPLLLHFALEDGVVQVSADNSVAARVAEAEPTSPRHADFDIEPEEPYTPPETTYAAPPPAPYEARSNSGQDTRRISYDDRDRYDPGTGYQATPEYASGRAEAFFADPPTADRRYDSPGRYDERTQAQPTSGAPHPFAATPPPPVPPQTARRIHVEQHRATEEPSAAQRAPQPRQAEQPPASRGIPEPLAEPIPLRIDTEENEVAAKRLAALLRDNPTLLRQAPPD
jgi:hypothetical protein